MFMGVTVNLNPNPDFKVLCHIVEPDDDGRGETT